jgi:hypothetical protein
MTEQRKAFEIIESIYKKANEKPLSKASHHDIDFMIGAPKGTCKLMLTRETATSPKYFAKLVSVEQLFINQ